MQDIQWDGPQCTGKKWVVMVEIFLSVTERRDGGVFFVAILWNFCLFVLN